MTIETKIKNNIYVCNVLLNNRIIARRESSNIFTILKFKSKFNPLTFGIIWN